MTKYELNLNSIKNILRPIFEILKTILLKIVNSFNNNGYYQIEGGGLPLTAPTYVWREADEQLYQFASNFQPTNRVCFILAARQNGKSSLMIRTAKRLTDEDVICVRINLHELGTIESENAFWLTLLQLICKQVFAADINLIEKLYAFWQQTPVQPTVKFEDFIADEIIGKMLAKKLIIFIDEIQTLINWNLQDSFIGFIKALSQSEGKTLLEKLTFVLLGVAKPSDLVTSSSYALNLGQQVELGMLTADACGPLLPGLEKVSADPVRVLKAILYWTGGQPFLTQLLCQLVASSGQIPENLTVENYVEKIVTDKIITNWRTRRQDRLSHFQEIENWFIRGQKTSKKTSKSEKLAALRTYRQILNSGSVAFRDDPRHWDLLISGLVKKEDESLKVANRIYAEIFTDSWIAKNEKRLQEDEMPEPFSTIYNRDVFILIDQSGSMVLEDADTGDESRYEYLYEVLLGHVNSILNARSGEDKICDRVSVYFFSKKNAIVGPYLVNKATQLRALFTENQPKTKTFIGDTLNRCLDTWLSQGKPNNRGAFFITYTDGVFDDEPDFVNCIERACREVEDIDINPEKAVKFIVLGLGRDIDERRFLELDFEVNDRRPYSIVSFNLVNEVDDIIEELERQIETNNPFLAFPQWAKERHPDFVRKVVEAHSN